MLSPTVWQLDIPLGDLHTAFSNKEYVIVSWDSVSMIEHSFRTHLYILPAGGISGLVPFICVYSCM